MFASGKTNAVANGTANYIEDVFSTYLYTGNGSTQTITNGIDLSTKGGLVWIKRRNAAVNNRLFDTARGATYALYSNLTNAQATEGSSLTSFDSSGFSLSSDSGVNINTGTYASWTFRKQPKFFDVVTYTGDGTERTISHNLGSVPGCIIVKRTDTTSNWTVYHRELNATNAYQYYISLNLTTAKTADNIWGAAPTSTVFTVTADAKLNASGGTYVAYVFAHDAGGFGLTGTDNVISCGSFTSDSSGMATVNLGYEAQWVLMKNSQSTEGWYLVDNMRGNSLTSYGYLQANTSAAELAGSGTYIMAPTATGFLANNLLQSTSYIYIAIRRGPMKVPTSGTSVFSPLYFTGDDSTSRQLTSGFPVDTFLGKRTVGDTSPFVDRLRGKDLQLYTSLTNAEATGTNYCRFDSSVGPIVGYNASGININSSAYNYRTYSFRRAPSFHDVVCWSGDDVAPRNINHNLTVVPEMMIVKNRSSAGTSLIVYHKNLTSALYLLQLETNAAQQSGSNAWRSTAPTASVFTVGNDSWVNQSGSNYVNYLFATCPGVSKVFSYTGNGSSQTINCGFTGGARFVLIKRTDSTGNWYVWDTARGIVSGNDAYFELNLSDAEVTSNDTIDTNSTGFVVNQVSATNVNVSSATYIGLAIA